MFGSFLPDLGWLAPPKSIPAWEPTLLWNQLISLTTPIRPLSIKVAGRQLLVSSFLVWRSCSSYPN